MLRYRSRGVRLLAKISALCLYFSAPIALPLLAAPAEADVQPGWLDYQRPATYEPVKSSVLVPVRDGTLIGCQLYRPGRDGLVAPGRFPVVVSDFVPYTAAHALTTREPESGAAYFASRGYVVARCDVRGTGGSGGDFPSWFQPREAQDNYDLIEWLARQPWSTGRVGQVGQSYGSLTTLRVATLNPPHLVSIVPVDAPGNIYEWVYPGGIHSANGPAWAAAAAALSYGRVDPVRITQSFAAHPLYDDFWRQIDVTDNLQDIRVPALIFGGWQDYFTKGTIDDFEGISNRAWLVMHPGQHVWADEESHAPVPIGALLAWWDHWLLQLPSAPLPSARVTSFECPVNGAQGWEELSAWPPADVRSRRMYLRADRQLSATSGLDGITSYKVNPFDGPARTAVGAPYPEDPGADQRIADQQRLTFTTEPLADDAVVAGTARVHLRAALSADDAYFVVKLEDVAPDGKVVAATDGYLRASHRDADDHEVAIAPGTFNDYTIVVRPTDWRFAKGHQIRIALTSGDMPMLVPDAPLGTITIASGSAGSWVDLPMP